MNTVSNWLLKATVLAASAASSALAVAAPGEPITVGAGSGGVMWFDFSESLVGALHTANIVASGLGQTRFTEDLDTGAMRVETALDMATVVHDGETQRWSTTSARSSLGMRLDNPPTPPGWKGGSSPRRGGWVTLSNLEVDFTTRAVYADLTGAHAVGSKTRQHMWSFDDVDHMVEAGSQPDTLWVRSDVTGLRITQEGFELLATGLDLSPTLGIPSFRSISDYGMISTAYMVDTRIVPEPGTWALMGFGLACLALRARRKPGTDSQGNEA